MDKFQESQPDNSLTPSAPPLDDSQLPWRVWLSRNGVYLVVAVAAFVALYTYMGPESVWAIGKAALGLGFVIFFHELGHFAVAKWCDVHVETFSIGFGPALPGCSFQKGETTYKLALVPLGGYVKMVGEGSENEEDDLDPRSFKNKTVGQRMAIISAGVIMNVILGCVCLVVAYRNGLEQIAGVIAATEPGSPAWKKGVRTGMLIEQIDDVKHPFYDDLKYKVMLSQKGQPVAFRFLLPASNDPSESRVQEVLVDIEPRREEYDSAPVIGVLPASQLKLLPSRDVKKAGIAPVSGAALGARQLDLRPDDLVVATTDPDDPNKMKPLPPSADGTSPDYRALAERLERLAGKPVKLTVKHGGTSEDKQVEALGFLAGDRIVGTSDDGPQNRPFNPYRVKKLPADTFRDPNGHEPSYFEYLRRLQNLAGQPLVFQVLREKADADAEPVSVLVPPAFHSTLGLRMQMGKVTAIREGSPAQEAGVQTNDVIQRVEMSDDKGASAVWVVTDKDTLGEREKHLDPLRLPDELRQWAEGRTGVQVALTVLRDQHHDMDKQRPLQKVSWQADWKYEQVLPTSLRSPMAIAELGVAYQVETRVQAVQKGSPADKANLQAGDVLLEIRFKEKSRKGDTSNWGPWAELWSKDSEQPDDKRPEAWWAFPFAALQGSESREVQLKVRRGTEVLPDPVELTAALDTTWPLDERGLRFDYDRRLKQASSNVEALTMGVNDTYHSIVRIYLSLYSMLTNRISAKKNLRGPIDIAATAYEIAGHDLNTFIWFLGMISVNLAVVNFLPVPVLDGGHMVFLIYEKIRGKPASEHVRLVATYVGLLLILSLMAFVIYLDIKRRVVGS